MTVMDVKRQAFPDIMERQKSVRFIAKGRILQDTELLSNCNLGVDAHIHVSITEGVVTPKALDACPKTIISTSDEAGADVAPPKAGSFLVNFIILPLFFAITGGLLAHAWTKRYSLSMQKSKLMFICGSVWVYLFLFHALPVLFQATKNVFERADVEHVRSTTRGAL